MVFEKTSVSYVEGKMVLSWVRERFCFMWSMDEGSGVDKCVGRVQTTDKWVSGRGIKKGGWVGGETATGVSNPLKGSDGVRGDGGTVNACTHMQVLVYKSVFAHQSLGYQCDGETPKEPYLFVSTANSFSEFVCF